MTYGLTSTGFTAKTHAEILSEIESLERELIYSGLDLSPNTVLGQINTCFAQQGSQVWELLASIGQGLDPDSAPETLLVSLAKLTGVSRQSETYGEVLVTVGFSQATTIAAGGLTIADSSDPTNLWRNVFDIVAAGTGTVPDCTFRSLTAGPTAIAAPGQLTVIATPVTGVVSATNPAAATPGEAAESVDELRLRREQSPVRQGKGSVAAIRSEILSGGSDGTGVPGVLDCRVIENDTDATDGYGVPAKSIWVLIWDGDTPAALNQDIGEAIYAARGAGVLTYGDTDVTVKDPWDRDQTMRFSRMTGVPIEVVVEVSGDADPAAIQAAVIDYGESLSSVATIVYAKVLAAIAGVDGVEDVLSLTIQGGTTNVSLAIDEKSTWDASDIDVTVS